MLSSLLFLIYLASKIYTLKFFKMASQKKIMKFFVLIILAVFLLSSGLVSVMYFVDMNKNIPTDTLSGENITGELPSEEVVDISSLGL